MKRRDLLVELGTEEIPARFLPAARAALAAAAQASFASWGMAPKSLVATGTPRRLVLLAGGLPDMQDSREEVVAGPPWERAFDAAGQPTPAVIGFARKQGVELSQLSQIEIPKKGVVAGFRRLQAGQPTAALLAPALPTWVAALPFGKTMRWEPSGFRFARPLRWLVAMFGGDVVAATVAGLEAGAVSRGHRFLGRPFKVRGASDYRRRLAAQGVMLEPAARRDAIVAQGNVLAEAAGLRVDWDDAVLDEVVDLVEWPGPMLGRFDAAFLELPPAVLIAPMKAHQRYFPLRDAAGALAPRFLFVANRPDDPQGLIAAGNARVLSARLNDARFFWRQDRAKSLDEHAGSLRNITWQQGLGTLDDLRRRVGDLALSDELRLPVGSGTGAADTSVVRRAGELYLADLGTHLVYEFAELQGEIGALLAAEQGEAADVVAAMREAHWPKVAEGRLPDHPAAILLALAHRIDLIVGNLILGHEVKGNQDPFGLRRAAIAVFRMLERAGTALPLRPLCARHVERYRAQGAAIPSDIAERLGAFWAGRLNAWLESRGEFGAAECRAVVRADNPDVRDALARLAALRDLLGDAARRERFLDTYKRLRNIARDAAMLELHRLRDWPDGESQFFAAAVVAAHEAVAGVAGTSAGDMPQAVGQARAHLHALAAIETAAERLFTDVRINADDPAVREARQRLVATARQLLRGFADFDQIIGG